MTMLDQIIAFASLLNAAVTRDVVARIDAGETAAALVAPHFVVEPGRGVIRIVRVDGPMSRTMAFVIDIEKELVYTARAWAVRRTVPAMCTLTEACASQWKVVAGFAPARVAA